MTNNDIVKDITERYIYQVVKYLPAKSRGDIEQELRTLIADMLEARAGGLAPARKDIEIVLMELGAPAALAAKYSGRERSLIGPALFPMYWLVLRIAVAAGTGGLIIASIVQSVVSASPWYAAAGSAIGNIYFVLISAIAWVTAIFAVMEHFGLKAFDSGSAFIDSLPPVPLHKESIPKAEPIASLIFTAAVITLFTFTPQVMGAINFTTGAIAPIFDLDVLRRALPLFIITFVIGAARDATKLLEGRYTRRLALTTIAADAIGIVLTCVIFYGFPVWNGAFVSQLNTVYEGMPDVAAVGGLETLFGVFTRFFPLVVVFAFALDCGVSVYRAWRYGVRVPSAAQ